MDNSSILLVALVLLLIGLVVHKRRNESFSLLEETLILDKINENNPYYESTFGSGVQERDADRKMYAMTKDPEEYLNHDDYIRDLTLDDGIKQSHAQYVEENDGQQMGTTTIAVKYTEESQPEYVTPWLGLNRPNPRNVPVRGILGSESGSYADQYQLEPTVKW